MEGGWGGGGPEIEVGVAEMPRPAKDSAPYVVAVEASVCGGERGGGGRGGTDMYMGIDDPLYACVLCKCVFTFFMCLCLCVCVCVFVSVCLCLCPHCMFVCMSRSMCKC